MLLLWVLLIPNAFSFGLIAFALLDLLSTRTLDRCFTRKSIVETLERAGASTGAIETLLESLYERCVLVPSLFLRQLTLFYCFLLQIHSFCRSVRFSYGVSDPRWLFALFGGHGEASSVRDRYVQIVLFIVLYGFLRVALNPSLNLSSSTIISTCRTRCGGFIAAFSTTRSAPPTSPRSRPSTVSPR